MSEGIQVTFLDQTGAKSVKARISPTVKVKKILPNIITKMQLPVQSPDGTPMSYSLDHKEGGRRLQEEQTLPEAGVNEGDHLIVYPEIVAGRGDRYSFVEGRNLLGTVAFSRDVKHGSGKRTVVTEVPAKDLVEMAHFLRFLPGENVGHAIWHFKNPREPFPCETCPEKVREGVWVSPEDVVLAGREIRSLEVQREHEKAQVMERELLLKTLQAIAENRCEDPRALAAQLLDYCKVW
jgi:hypothetical protein